MDVADIRIRTLNYDAVVDGAEAILEASRLLDIPSEDVDIWLSDYLMANLRCETYSIRKEY